MGTGPGVLGAAGIPIPRAGQPGEGALSSTKRFWRVGCCWEVSWGAVLGVSPAARAAVTVTEGPGAAAPELAVLKFPPRDI